MNKNIIIKRITSTMMLVCMFLSILVKRDFVNAEDNTFIGKAYLDFSETATSITGDYQSASLSINSFGIDLNNNIDLYGKVLYNNQILDININGHLNKGLLHKEESLYGTVIDSTENFDIVSLSLKKYVRDGDLLVNTQLANKEVLSIYIMNKETRDLVLFEIDYNRLNSSSVDYLLAEELDDPLIEQWWVKILKPNVEIKNDKTSLDEIIPSSISPFSVTASNTRTFSYVLSTDNTYKYYIRVSATASTASHNGIQQVYDTAQLTVTDQYVEHNGVYLGDFYHLLVIKPKVQVRLTNSGGASNVISDWIQQSMWSMNTTYTTGGLTFALKELSLNLKFGTLSWTPPKTVNYSNGIFNTTAITTKGIEISFPYAIQQLNQNCNLGILKNNQGTNANEIRIARYDWTFDIAYVNSSTPVLNGQSISVFAYYTN